MASGIYYKLIVEGFGVLKPLCAVAFFVDIRGRDRFEIGLRNLALDHYGIDSLNELSLLDLETFTRSEFISAISNLQSFMVVCLEGRGRMWPNRCGIETVRPWQMHRSRPILGSVTSFDRIEHDPRPISHDLKRVYTGFVDPLRSVYIWFKLLDKWDVTKSSRQHNVNYEFLVAQFRAGYLTGEVNTSVIVDRESAMGWVQAEDATWTDLQHQRADNIRAKGKNVPLESDSRLARAPQPAIGFWLFPIEVLGEVPGPGASEDCGDWPYKRVINMAAYSPQLCLSDLH
ncbi:unnamed protein product [Clonostachys rosea]|uniref:Uncharacterized protein n=1 Tax=Bionectria ochroleuca TaxID=29856 RepID=A0ABY6ULV3_BIOOC|nr:unnamed protein product [Clonostachys rosea]